MTSSSADGQRAAQSVDSLLDSIDPSYAVFVGWNWGKTDYVAEIFADDATDSHGATVLATGTGATRRDAIQSAVEKAKEQTDER